MSKQRPDKADKERKATQPKRGKKFQRAQTFSDEGQEALRVAAMAGGAPSETNPVDLSSLELPPKEAEALSHEARVLEALPHPIALLDSTGRILWVNRAWRHFAIANDLPTATYAVGANYVEICERATGPNATEAPTVAQGLRDVLSGKVDTFSMEYPCHSPTEKRWFRVLITPIVDGFARGAVVSHINITGEVLAREALEENEAHLRLGLEAAQAGIWRIQLAEDTIEFDETCAKLLGWQHPSRCSPFSAFLRLVFPQDRDHVRAVARLAHSAVDVYDAYFRVRWRDGSIHFIHARGHALASTRDAAPTYVTGILFDETESQRRAREHEAVVKLSRALRSATNLDEAGRVILEEIVHAMDAEAGLIALREGEEEKIVTLGAIGRWEPLQGTDATWEEGILGRVASTQTPYFSESAWEDPQCLRPDLLRGLRGFMALPLISHQELTGVLAVGRTTPFDAEDVQLVTALADLASNALARIRHYRALEERLEELRGLHEIDLAITHTLDLDEVLSQILEHTLPRLGMDAGSVYLLEGDSDILVCRAALGFKSLHVWHARPSVGLGLVGEVAKRRAPILLSGHEELLRKCRRSDMLAEEGFSAYAGLPLLLGPKLIGVLNFISRQPRHFTPQWVSFAMMLATQTTMAINNSQLHSELQLAHAELIATYDSTIEGWARAMDYRDSETLGHSARVTGITLTLMREFGATPDDLVIIRRGALLHDIGKMAIPDSILRKPGPLTPEEWELMRKHPLIAIELLRPIKFLEPSLPIPAYHHERWDGTGYPFGLKGEEIPLPARVFAVVDVWDALISDRPYRPAWPREKALEYIAEQAGKQFDPEAVRVFLDLARKGHIFTGT